MEPIPHVDRSPRASGALGPALEAAIEDYQRSLAAARRAEAAHARAQRQVSEARARLTALTLGAKVTGSRALVVVDPTDDEPADEAVRAGMTDDPDADVE